MPKAKFTQLVATTMKKAVATLAFGCFVFTFAAQSVHGQDAKSEVWTGTLSVPKSPADDVKFVVNKADSTITMIHMNAKYGPHDIELGDRQLKFPLEVGGDPVQCILERKKADRVYEGNCGSSFGLTMTPPPKQ